MCLNAFAIEMKKRRLKSNSWHWDEDNCLVSSICFPFFSFDVWQFCKELSVISFYKLLAICVNGQSKDEWTKKKSNENIAIDNDFVAYIYHD